MKKGLLADLNLQKHNQGGCCGHKLWLSNSQMQITSMSPIDATSMATVQLCDHSDYETIMRVAHQAFLNWRNIPAPKRGEVILAIAEQLRCEKDALGTLIATEMGKSKAEGDGEVQEMIDIAYFAVGQSRMLYGLTMPSERKQHRLYEQWHPLGIVGVISAFNFPMAVWSWNAFIAAICGNTLVWKPSSKTPLCAIAVQHICNHVMKQFNLEGVFNLFLPEDQVLLERFVSDKRINLLSFTGSTNTGRQVATLVAQRLGKALLELGGNNAVIVDETASLDLAIPAIVFGAIGTSGQRCTSTRRVFIHESIFPTVETRLKKAYQQLRIGDPRDSHNHMGPLIDAQAVEQFKLAIEQIKQLSGDIIIGGHIIEQAGFYVEPTIVKGDPSWPLLQCETFVPILYIMPYTRLNEVMIEHNRVTQGLSSSLFSHHLPHTEYFLSHLGSDCGIANVNIGTSGAEIGGAFGGEKDTGGGRESGSDAWKAYMRRQTNTINWGQELPLAQGIVFNL